MTVKDTTGIVALDARRGFGRRDRAHTPRPRFENTRVHRLLAQANETATRTAILLRESDHRIKNSLQIVSSLLLMQSRCAGIPEAAGALQAAAGRIEAVARVHGALQHSDARDAVKLGEALSTLCQSLHAMAGNDRVVSIVVSDENIETSAAYAQSVMLVVNELVINALRHAFPGAREGAIRISIGQSNEELRIVVADDGCGLATDHLAGGGYGSLLVRALIRQISGAIHAESAGGARFTITAPLQRAPPAVSHITVRASV